jgi:hypothetical protein
LDPADVLFVDLDLHFEGETLAFIALSFGLWGSVAFGELKRSLELLRDAAHGRRARRVPAVEALDPRVRHPGRSHGPDAPLELIYVLDDVELAGAERVLPDEGGLPVVEPAMPGDVVGHHRAGEKAPAGFDRAKHLALLRIEAVLSHEGDIIVRVRHMLENQIQERSNDAFHCVFVARHLRTDEVGADVGVGEDVLDTASVLFGRIVKPNGVRTQPQPSEVWIDLEQILRYLLGLVGAEHRAEHG